MNNLVGHALIHHHKIVIRWWNYAALFLLEIPSPPGRSLELVFHLFYYTAEKTPLLNPLPVADQNELQQKSVLREK